MRLYLLLSLTLALLSAGAQQTTNLLLGYQEFPTSIMGHASDANGNMYYTGIFKGPLTVKGQVLTTGAGLEDIFWVKTDAAGQVKQYKTYGSPNSDFTYSNGLAMGPGQHMYFIAKGIEPVAFGGITVQPYSGPLGPMPFNCIVSKDTSGNVAWVRKTNLNLVRLFAAGNLVHAFGTVHIGAGATLVGDSTVLDSLGATGLVHLIFDASGKLLGKKTLFTHPGQAGTLVEVGGYRDGSLLLSLRIQGNNQFFMNGTPVPLPFVIYPYQVLIKTDTSYNHFRARVLNANQQSITGTGTSMHLAANDSLYMILNVDSGQPYTLDGQVVPVNWSTLMVLDSTLTASRAALLGPSLVASYGPGLSSKRRVYFRSIVSSGNRLFFTGQFVGINEAPMNVVPTRDTMIPIILQAKGLVDLNGPSKSFVASTDLGVTSGKFNWYGDHREYEYAFVAPVFVHQAHNRIVFVQGHDNIWNPFVVDTSLQLISGSMQKNADRPEHTQMVTFFGDGSRIVAGYASGKTALDSTSNVPSNSLRRDLFFACINPNGTVRWFNRIQSTLLQPMMRKLLMRQGKAYSLVNYTGTQNDSNFIRTGNQLFDIRVNASLLTVLDSSGQITTLNLPHAVYKHGNIQDFSFFSNGDLALLVNPATPLSLPGFSTASGIYVLRVHPATGALIDARKMSGSILPPVFGIEVDKQDEIYISTITGANFFSPTSLLNLHNNTGLLDTLTVVHNTVLPSHQGLLKLAWNDFKWFRRLYGGAGGASTVTNLFLVNNRPLMMVIPQINNLPLYWENQLIHNGPYAGRVTLIMLDTAGHWVRSRFIPSMSGGFIRKGSGEKIYVSGSLNGPVQIDTIQIGNAGFSDAIGLVLDSTLKARRSFRLGSSYSEVMFDMDLFKDSVAAFTYTAQVVPQLMLNRTFVQDGDYEPDAFLSTMVLGTGAVTGIRDPLPAGTQVRIQPNPLQGRQVRFQSQTPVGLKSLVQVYSAAGQFICSTAVQLSPGTGPYGVSLPATVQPGLYFLMVSNRSWKTSLPFVVR